MGKFGISLLMAAMVAAYGPLVSARGAGAGGGHSGGASASHSIKAEANSNGQFSSDRDTGPDRARERMSEQGLANTNGPNAEDQEKGLDRADERQSAQASDHEKATTHTRVKKTFSKKPKTDSE